MYIIFILILIKYALSFLYDPLFLSAILFSLPTLQISKKVFNNFNDLFTAFCISIYFILKTVLIIILLTMCIMIELILYFFNFDLNVCCYKVKKKLSSEQRQNVTAISIRNILKMCGFIND